VRLDGPLRVMIVADEVSGPDDALRAVAGMREARTVTVVQDGVSAGAAGADRVLGPLSAAETAAVMARSDVLVRTAREEALPLVALRAFHAGATCVVAPATGHDEVVTHGFDGLVTSFDDDRGTARALDLLARDRRLLAFLRENAVATARAWPSWTQASGMLALALQRIARAPC
jgi:glycosyltransferase involved in cell wall biosynthesis